MQTVKPLLILAIGNPSRGDDAIGPTLLAAFEPWLATQPAGVRAAVELLQDQQLMVEHLADLTGRDSVLFVDAAVPSVDTALALSPVQPDAPRPAMPGHQMTPAELLSWYQHLNQSPPPPCAALTIRGEQFELGAALSPSVQARLDDALQTMIRWVEAHRHA